MKKVVKGAIDKSDKSLIVDAIEKELKDVYKVLNHFLKAYFTIDIHSLQEYLYKVKDLLI